MTTTVETIADSNFNDNTFPVLSNDPVGLATIATDFIFDAQAPACYAGGVLPTVGAAVPTAGLVNLARNSALALGRTDAQAVTAVPGNTSRLATFNGSGWSMAPGAHEGFLIRKAGTANNRVGEPLLESYADNLVIVWVKASALPSSGQFYAPVLLGQNGTTAQGWNGIVTTSANGSFVKPGDHSFGYGLGVVNQFALYVDFDTVAGTTTQRFYRNGSLLDTRTGPAPSSMASNNANAVAMFGANAGGCNGFDGIIYRVQREFTSLSGMDVDGVTAFVAADFVANTGRFV